MLVGDCPSFEIRSRKKPVLCVREVYFVPRASETETRLFCGRSMNSDLVSWAIQENIGNTNHKMVLVILAFQCPKGSDRASPGIRAIGKLSGLSDRSVQRSLRWLEKSGYVNAETVMGGATVYTVVDIPF